MFDFSRADLTLDEAGKPRLLYHTCAKCGHTKAPDEQELFESDGLAAFSKCVCGKAMVTLLGEPWFIQWATEEMNIGDDCILRQHPISEAVANAFARGF